MSDKLTDSEMIGKQVKINGAFPQKVAVIINVIPAGVQHPEKLFRVTILDSYSNTTSLTRSEFELL